MKTYKNNLQNTIGMKKKLIAFAAVVLMTMGTATAQIFLDDEMLANRGWLGDIDEMGNVVPFQELEVETATYTPVGNGIFALTVLGGAYLLRKKKKESIKE